MITIEKQWGTRVGLCAWCNKPATKQYQDVNSQNELTDYQVCDKCYKERV